MLEFRLSRVPELKAKITLLSSQAIMDIKAALKLRFRAYILRENADIEDGKESWDISLFQPAQVQELLGSLGIGDGAHVRLIWLSDNVGIELDYGDFVHYYDDLWYPSSDDIWLTNPSADYLLEIDHEERLTFIRPR